MGKINKTMNNFCQALKGLPQTLSIFIKRDDDPQPYYITTIAEKRVEGESIVKIGFETVDMDLDALERAREEFTPENLLSMFSINAESCDEIRFYDSSKTYRLIGTDIEESYIVINVTS